VETLSRALEGRKHVVMESGTGTGKTVCTLYSAYSYAISKGKRVIYTTRTNSQHHQVITETKSINRASDRQCCVVGIQGRSNFCLLLKDLEGMRRGGGREPSADGDSDEEPTTIEELAAYCTKRRRFTKDKLEKEMAKGGFTRVSLVDGEESAGVRRSRARIGKRGCVYYEKLLRGGVPSREDAGGDERGEEPVSGGLSMDEDDSVLQEEQENVFVQWVLENTPDTGELLRFCRLNSVCPYELNKMACEKADCVVVPYIFFFAPFLRHHLLDWMNTRLRDVVLIVDEAHNLPDYARELQSSTLSRYALELVVSEGEKHGLMNITDEVSLLELCLVIDQAMDVFLEDYLVDEDGLIPDFGLEERILGHFRIPSPRFKQTVGSIIKLGVAVKEKKLNNNQLPSSHIYSFGSFLLHWLSSQENHYIHLITKGGADGKTLKRPERKESELANGSEEAVYFTKEDGSKERIGVIEKTGTRPGTQRRPSAGNGNPCLEIFCLDPSLTTSIANDCHMSIHMSGTLKPMEQYVDSTGLDKGRLVVRNFPSPFPEENRRFLYAPDVTTRYDDYTKDPSIRERIGGYLKNIALLAQARSTVFFFPSFRLLTFFSTREWVGALDRSVFIERQGMSNDSYHQLIQDFKQSKGGILFSVVGGRTSEGMDFPGRELEIVVVVGIPYPKPSIKLQALQFYNEEKFRQGYFYTFHAPASRKLAQALGRLIRTETDRGIGIVLDKRAHRFGDYIFDMRKSDEILGDLGSFEFVE